MSAVRFISSDAIRSCPWCILMPQHYRSDDTCRCDDPEHTDMAEWGYVWDDETRRWTGTDDD